jgi:hypothetical protein
MTFLQVLQVILLICLYRIIEELVRSIHCRVEP